MEEVWGEEHCTGRHLRTVILRAAGRLMSPRPSGTCWGPTAALPRRRPLQVHFPLCHVCDLHGALRGCPPLPTSTHHTCPIHAPTPTHPCPPLPTISTHHPCLPPLPTLGSRESIRSSVCCSQMCAHRPAGWAESTSLLPFSHQQAPPGGPPSCSPCHGGWGPDGGGGAGHKAGGEQTSAL